MRKISGLVRGDAHDSMVDPVTGMIATSLWIYADIDDVNLAHHLSTVFVEQLLKAAEDNFVDDLYVVGGAALFSVNSLVRKWIAEYRDVVSYARPTMSTINDPVWVGWQSLSYDNSNRLFDLIERDR